MNLFEPRKLIFKAWNKEAKLLMRLNTIECRKGELFKKDHIILQFTGLYDKNEDEIFELDIVMIGPDKYVVVWDGQRNGWSMVRLKDKSGNQPFQRDNALKAQRLWSYFESEEGGDSTKLKT